LGAFALYSKSPEKTLGTRRLVMKIVTQSIALAVMLSMLFSGPFAIVAAAQQPTPPPPPLLQDEMKTSDGAPEPTAAYDVGAGVVNVFYVPGKVLTCGAGAVVGVALLLVTLGSGYKAAVAFGREGCGGKWAVTGEDLRTSEWFGAGEQR
jgi:hypothetical protein